MGTIRVANIHNLALIGSPPEHRSYGKSGFKPILDGTTVEAFATVDSGTARHTRIGKSWLGKHVHVGHDTLIGDGCEIVTGTVIAGWVEIGDNVRIGINSTIKNRVKIGDGARIGAGAVVVKDVPAGETWVGNPACRIDHLHIDPLWVEWAEKAFD